MRVVVVLLYLVQYAHSYCMVPNKEHVSAQNLTEAGVTTIIGTTSTDAVDYENSGFYQCSTLKSIEIPASVTEIGYRAFQFTPNLHTVTVLGDITTIYSQAFWAAGEHAGDTFTMTFKGNVGAIDEGAFGWAGYNNTQTTITFEGQVGTILRGQTKWGAFKRCGSDTDILKITFQGDVGTIQGHTTSNNHESFADCGYNSLNMSIVFQEKVETIENHAFLRAGRNANTLSLTFQEDVGTISVGAFKWSGFTSTSYTVKFEKDLNILGNNAFQETNLTSIDFSKATSLQLISPWAFYKTTALTSVTIPSSVKEIGASAFRESGLTSVTIPSSVISIGSYAFSAASALISIDFSNAASLETIGSYAFYYAIALESVTIPSSVTEIKNEAFWKCYDLESVDFSQATSLNTIGRDAFQDTTSLTSVDMSGTASLASIGDYAFKDSALTSATVPVCISLGTDVFPSTTHLNKVFPQSCVRQYLSQGITADDILIHFSAGELAAAYRVKGNCPA